MFLSYSEKILKFRDLPSKFSINHIFHKILVKFLKFHKIQKIFKNPKDPQKPSLSLNIPVQLGWPKPEIFSHNPKKNPKIPLIRKKI
jgi:hypothetical protein